MNVSTLVNVTPSIRICGAEFLMLREEHPNLRVFSIQPGMVEAEGGHGMVVRYCTPFAKDKELLTGDVTLYLQEPVADHLRRVFLNVNWDIARLDEHKGEFVDKKLLKLSFLFPVMLGWRLGNDSSKSLSGSPVVVF